MGFSKDIIHFNFVSEAIFAINPTIQYPKTQFSNVPSFQHSKGEALNLYLMQNSLPQHTKVTLIKYYILISLTLVVLVTPVKGLAFERYNRVVKYDRYFSKYSKRFFGPGFDWQYFKAQAVAESRLKAAATSSVGAVGIMQIMPRTFADITRKNPSIKGTRAQPRWNIAAGIYYDRTLWNLWKAERPFFDRINFMFGSYNAGKGSILKAQKVAENKGLDPNLWNSIEPALPLVTGKRSKETIGYVRKITSIKGVLK
jgi:membrane-bound lytic murein transglycosylase F